jgi:hypothetical protein
MISARCTHDGGHSSHRYVEVGPTADGFVNASTLELSSAIAAAVNETVRSADPSVLVFAGEVRSPLP